MTENTMTATHVLLAIAWAVVIIGLRGQPLPMMIGIGAVAGGILVMLGYWFSPDPVPGYAGILYPKFETLLTGHQAPLRIMEIGNSGAKLELGNPNSNALFSFFDDSSLILETTSGRLYVSTKIRDEDGKLIAELSRNEWKVAPPPNTWDRNYDKNTLEVKNIVGRVALQIRLLPDRVQIQGEWFAPNAAQIANSSVYGIRIVESDVPNKLGGLFVLFGPGRPPVIPPTRPADRPFVKPLFKYPSELHFGELITP